MFSVAFCCMHFCQDVFDDHVTSIHVYKFLKVFVAPVFSYIFNVFMPTLI